MGIFPLNGQFLIMRLLWCNTIPANVPARQNALSLPVGLFLPFARMIHPFFILT